MRNLGLWQHLLEISFLCIADHLRLARVLPPQVEYCKSFVVAKVASGGSERWDAGYWVCLPDFANGVCVAYQFCGGVGEVVEDVCMVGCE